LAVKKAKYAKEVWGDRLVALEFENLACQISASREVCNV
jgi:hypothetical protein